MFDKSTRTLMAMMFERSTVDEINGKLEDGRRWDVNIRRPNLFRGYTYYDGCIAGAYIEDFRGDTLDETLDKMDDWLAEDEAIKAEIRGEAV